MKRLGPELKMPELKVPTVLADLWWDLWDRRLLPLVVLIVAAIVAVPFLMSSGSKPAPRQLVAAAGAAAAEPASAGTPDLTVVQAEPGLRDYHRRLSHLSPTDPFKQRFTAPQVLTHLGKSSTSTTTTTTKEPGGGEPSGPVSSGPPAQEGETGGAPSSGGGRAKPHLILFTFAINVRIIRSGGKEAAAGEKPESWARKRVLPLTPLPGKKVPVVTYMGRSKTGKALLLVSTKVSSISGEGKCILGEVSGEVSGGVAGEGACQLLEVEPGFPATFVYGANEVHYTIKVMRIELVVIGHS